MGNCGKDQPPDDGSPWFVNRFHSIRVNFRTGAQSTRGDPGPTYKGRLTIPPAVLPGRGHSFRLDRRR